MSVASYRKQGRIFRELVLKSFLSSSENLKKIKWEVKKWAIIWIGIEFKKLYPIFFLITEISDFSINLRALKNHMPINSGRIINLLDIAIQSKKLITNHSVDMMLDLEGVWNWLASSLRLYLLNSLTQFSILQDHLLVKSQIYNTVRRPHTANLLQLACLLCFLLPATQIRLNSKDLASCC